MFGYKKAVAVVLPVKKRSSTTLGYIADGSQD